MLKKLALVAALAVPAIAVSATAPGFVSPAEAKTSVQIHLGVPYYSYRPGDDYRYYAGRGWYRPYHNRMQMSCGQGAREVRSLGYRNVRPMDCQGPRYTYRATKNGKAFMLSVNARNGRVNRL